MLFILRNLRSHRWRFSYESTALDARCPQKWTPPPAERGKLKKFLTVKSMSRQPTNPIHSDFSLFF